MTFADIVESEDDDRQARREAEQAHEAIADWLEQTGEALPEALRKTSRFGGAWVIQVSRILPQYEDLYIILTPKEIIGGKQSMGGFGHNESGQFIAISCLREPYDLTNVWSRFRTGFHNAFIHEFIHYKLWLKRANRLVYKSDEAVAQGDFHAYYNDDDEINSYYQEAIADAERFIKGVYDNSSNEKVRQYLDRMKTWSTDQIIQWVKKNFINKTFLSHLNQTSSRALNKRIYRWVDQSWGPLVRQALHESAGNLTWTIKTGYELRQIVGRSKLKLLSGSDFRDELHVSCWDGDKLVGDAELKNAPHVPDELWLMHVTVAPSHQHRGIGKQLVDRVIEQAARSPRNHLLISTFTDEGQKYLSRYIRAQAENYPDLKFWFNSDGGRQGPRSYPTVADLS